MLVLPLLIALFLKKQYRLIPFVFSAVGAVHFLLFHWLYRKPAYIFMSDFALSLAMIYARDGTEHLSTDSASQACLNTGLLLLLTAAYLIIF